MIAEELYELLEQQFMTGEFSDDWNGCYDSISNYICDNFKSRSIGLVCDFADTINKVYTAVFPSDKVLNKIITDEIFDAMLFVHHPATWDIRKAPNVFVEMDKSLVGKFKERRVSIFNFHVPLDNYSLYSTSVSLAEALEIEIKSPFGLYFGALCGVYGKSTIQTIEELKNKFESTVGHQVVVYNYGELVFDGNIAIVAGGGLSETIEEIGKTGIKALITGITVKNEFTKNAHNYAKENKITILGGTHYSTEKYACMKICEYFKKNNITAEFIEDIPVCEDM